MRRITLYFLLMFVAVSCGTNENSNADEVVSESRIDARFETCYYKDDLAKKRSDSVVTSILGTSNFNRAVRFNLNESSMNCQVDSTIQLVAFGDRNYCLPNSYDLSYSLLEKGEAIFEFRMIAGSNMKFDSVSNIVKDQLLGYRKLLDGDFKISYSEAKKIAKANGVDLEESNLELVKNETPSSAKKSAYHWEAELEYDQNSVVLLLIDVISGKTSKEVLSIGNIE